MISVTALTESEIMRILAAVLLISLTACTSPAATESTSQGAGPASAEKPQAMNNPVPEKFVARVRADLESRVETSDIRLLSAEKVTWPSGALGCPLPGAVYTQALVEGYHLVYQADGKTWDYRLNRRGGFRLCENAANPAGYSIRR